MWSLTDDALQSRVKSADAAAQEEEEARTTAALTGAAAIGGEDQGEDDDDSATSPSSLIAKQQAHTTITSCATLLRAPSVCQRPEATYERVHYLGGKLSYWIDCVKYVGELLLTRGSDGKALLWEGGGGGEGGEVAIGEDGGESLNGSDARVVLESTSSHSWKILANSELSDSLSVRMLRSTRPLCWWTCGGL